MTAEGAYPHLFLREWPFQIVPSPTFYTIWAGRRQIKYTLGELFERAQKRRPSVIYLLWGYFGAGKTHSLRYFQWRLNNDKRFPTLVGYHEFPASAKRFVDVYQSFMRNVNFAEIERVTKIVFNHFRQLYGDKASYKFDEEISHYNSDFTQAMSAVAKDEEKQTIRRWICAEKVYGSDLRKVGIGNKIEGDEDVFDIFGCLVRLLTYNHDKLPTLRSVMWFIDDFHEMEALKEGYKDVIRRGLTSIFNSCPENFCLVLAFTSRSVVVIKGLLSDALIDRLPMGSLTSVPAMSSDEAKEFVIDLLKQFRTENPPDEYYPFSSAAIEDIINFTARKGNLLPRSIMISFDLVLNKCEELVRIGKLDRIGSEHALRILTTAEAL